MSNQSLTLSIGQQAVWTPSPGGSDGNTVGPDGYNLTFSNNNSTAVQVQLNPTVNSNAKTAIVTGLAAGTAAVVWTLTPQSFYGGSAITQTDTITVSGSKRTISAANGTYGTPTQ